MKILSLNPNMIQPVYFRQNEPKPSCDDAKKRNQNLVLGTAGVCLLAVTGALIYKSSKKASNSVKNELKNLYKYELSERDKGFYEKMIKYLYSENPNLKTEDLRSITAPDEVQKLVKNFKQEHYMPGIRINEPAGKNISFDNFYKDLKSDNFRVSLNNHINSADEQSIKNFLESANNYANKVAQMNKNDGMPAFTIALTETNSLEECIKIIRLLAKNPEKYKNLKFIPGCEFTVKDGSKRINLVGLGFSPYNKTPSKIFTDNYAGKTEYIKKFLEHEPAYKNKKITIGDLLEENPSLKYSDNFINDCLEIYSKKTGRKFDKNLAEKYELKYTPELNEVVNYIKDKHGIVFSTNSAGEFTKL